MRFQIDVTQEDIDRGVRGSCTECPLVLAIERATGLSCFIGVGIHEVGGDGRSTPIRLPKKALRLIDDFDLGRPVKPFSFALDLEDSCTTT